MNKKMFYGLAVLVIAFVAAFGVNASLSSKGHNLSDISLANVEALARNENGGTLDCWNTISSQGPNASTHKTYCGECKAKICNYWSSASTCSN